MFRAWPDVLKDLEGLGMIGMFRINLTAWLAEGFRDDRDVSGLGCCLEGLGLVMFRDPKNLNP